MEKLNSEEFSEVVVGFETGLIDWYLSFSSLEHVVESEGKKLLQ